jgi:ribosomal protein S18 acetylase RimI-like enzyme
MTASDAIAIERLTTTNEEITRAVQRLYPQLTAGAVPDADAVARVQESGALVLLARYDGKIVGMATLVVATVLSGTIAHVEDVVVDVQHRGRGIGERLMQELMSHARAQGANSMALTSHPSREAANRLYQRLGFELGGTTYYSLDL